MPSKISVIIPCYNEEEKIEDCLNAFLKQSSIPDEIIAVDGGSTDKTVKIIKSYQKKNKRIKLFRETGRRSPANARNIGWKKATGDIIIFKDADTIPDKNYVSTVKKNFSGDVVEFPVKSFLKNNVSFLEKLLFYRESSTEKMHETIFSKKFIKKIGGYNAKLGVGEDMELKSRINTDIKKSNAVLNVAFSRVSSIYEFVKRYLWYGRTIPNYIYQTKNVLSFIRATISVSIFLLPLLLILSRYEIFFYLFLLSIGAVILFGFVRGFSILEKYKLPEAIFILPLIEIISFLALGIGIFIGIIQRITGKFNLGR